MELTRESFTGEWPFTTNKIKIVCGIDSPFSLHVMVGLKKYKLNGQARSGAPLELIWRENKTPGFEGSRISITPIFNLIKEAGLIK
jgi:hypothetical protein